ncbi:MAG: glycoside hydrolase family 3 N-terminal domain-containing protein [Candidatus Sericytochromatia bacterium]|nr:glycoside hydrolase family 3 N-terminal domain-containing protein [Candidatus Sericytochromatia bacterium]
MRIAPSQLTIRELIGQLMMPKLPDTAELRDPAVWQRVVDDQAKFSFGGYIVFRGDRTETPPMLAELQELSDLPLLIGADLERGAGQQFTSATNFPHAMALGAARDPDLAYQQGAITALEARRIGVHWIFAPCLDLVNLPANPIINVRGISDSPRTTGKLGAAFILGVQRHRAIACAKHFPGHGQTSVDSHEELPELNISRHRMEHEDLVPFRHAIEAGVQSIMVGHLAVPALDETGLPATMSKRIVTDLLREQMGFRGLIITDALDMGAITRRFDPGLAAVRALQAGVDVLLMPPDPDAVVAAVLRALEEGGLTKHRLLESVERIDQARLELGLWRYDDEYDPVPSTEWHDYAPAVAAIADAALTLVDDEQNLLPLKPGTSVCTLVLDDDDDADLQRTWREVLRELGDQTADVKVATLTAQSDEATIEAACAEAAKHEVVVVPVFMWVRAWKNRVSLPALLSTVPRRLAEAGAKVVLLSFTSPFLRDEMPEADAYICAYSPNTHCQRAAVQALWGRARLPGRLPVAPLGSSR